MKNIRFKRLLTLVLAVMMITTAMPINLLAEKERTVRVDHNDIASDKANYVNNLTPTLIVRPEDGTTAKKYLEEPDLPAIYTLRTDFKAEKGEKYSVNYQPYVASVGANATPDEQAKVNKKIKLPDMAGYKTPKGEEEITEDSKTIQVFKNSYDAIVKAAKNGQKKSDNGDKYLELREFRYAATTSNITVKHVFQDMEDFNKFTNKDGTITKNDGTVIDKEGHETKYDLKDPDQKAKYQEFVRDHENLKILTGNTGSTLEVQALQENERPGFVPQVEKLKTQVPEDTTDFKIEYRYNRAHYDVVFDTQDGTPLPARTYYYDQEIPKIDENSIPTKEGCEFQGWKPSHDLYGDDGTKYKKGEIIKDAKGNAIVDLGKIYYKKDGNGNLVKKNDDPVKEELQEEIKLMMPALKLGNGKEIPREKLTFTAVWKDKDKADYAIQFWTEKADHADNATIFEKYEYMSTRVYPQELTGKRPELDKESVGPVEVQENGVKKTLPGLPFPDLDKTRLQKIWKGEKFNRGHNLYLNKFFVYNKDLTKEQNKDPNKPTMTKAVSATGKTVYNIYYDRQVYDLYFTKSNVQPEKNTLYPEIWGYDPQKGKAVMLGGPGNLYHYKARFNEMMYKWPNDAKQTKGFTPGYQSFGWGPNYETPNWPVHLDTPPYRLDADQFLDMANYTSWGGYVKHIDKGDGTTKDLDRFDFTTLSFGIKQDHPSIPHHMDFWMDGFKDGETIIRYDLVRTKADTGDPGYGHKYPTVTGFTPRDYKPGVAWPVIREDQQEDGRVNEDRIGELNDERDEITTNNCGTYYNNFGLKLPIGQLDFISVFFSDSDEYGDVKEGGQSFGENGYLQFHYKRNKYPLRFNYDPTKIKGDSEFKYPVKGGTEEQNKKANALETFYEFPLKVLSPDLVQDDLERDDREYFKDKPENFLDNPNNLYKLGLYDLLQRDKTNPNEFAKDSKNNYVVKRPEGLASDKVFKGWALDPAGKKMVWKNPKETMPFHPTNLYAIWDIPDKRRKVTFDPNGGKLDDIELNDLTTEKKKIKEGDIGKEEENEYPVKGYYDLEKSPEDNKIISDAEKAKNLQVFTVAHGQKLKVPKTPPTRYGYDFLGWEVIYYEKDQNNNYTDKQDTGYRTRYKVPELYSFGTDVVAPIYLKAIWVENKRAEVKVYHYYLKRDSNNNFVLDDEKYPNPEPNSLSYKRVDDYVPATGEKQDEHWILANNDELMEKLSGTYKENGTDVELKPEYEAYNNRVKLNNTYFQTFRVQDNINVGTEDNPVYEPNPENVFRFYYRPFRTRNYKVNYIDERGKAEVDAFFKGLDLTDIDALMASEEYNKADNKGKEAILLEANKANKAKFEANRAKLEEILDKYKVIDKEEVTSACRHYDARNYRHIPGWKLVSAPQQQLFYDVNEDTNEFLGINGTGSDEIYFYYKDARVIEVPKDGKTPEGYVRVTFKIDDKHKGGVFKDKDGKEVTELHYDVIKGLKSDKLPHPVIWEEGKKDSEGKPLAKEENRYYITPDQGKKFIKWDNEKWLNAETEINKNYTFTAYFDWSGLSAKAEGLVRTEAFKDPKADGTKDWSNKFAPTIDDLKAQLVWKEIVEENGTKKEVVKPIPANVKIKFFNKNADGTETEITKDEDIFELVKEMGKDDATETVRTVNIIAKALFKTEAEIKNLEEELKVLEAELKTLKTANPQDKDKIQEQEAKITSKKGDIASAKQELNIPITVYKNRYEALNREWQKPKYLSDAEAKDAKDGGLKDILKDTATKAYVKVTVSPSGDMKAKNNKVYYVNPKAWVEIPEVKSEGSSTFINWTADKKSQNEDGKENGKFDFAKRHMFTEDTVIKPVDAKDAVEQTDPNNKPDVPKTYVKVVVKTTDKATDETKFEKTFWVNPTKEVTIEVTNPTGKVNQEIELTDGEGSSLGKRKVNYIYKGWQIVKTGEDDNSLTDLDPKETIDLAKNKYSAKVSVVEAIYEEEIDSTPLIDKSTISKLDTPKGKEITPKDLKGKITPPAGKEIESIEVISKPDGNTVGDTSAKVIVKYKDGSTEGSNEHPIVIPVEVHEPIIPAGPNGEKPEKAMENYVKITFKPGTGGKFKNTLTNEFVYYVSPEVELDLTSYANGIEKTPDVGYIGGNWDTSETKKLKDTFKTDTEFTFNFTKNANIVEKTNDPNQVIPKGYVKVTFRTEDENKGKLEGNVTEKIYYVDPNAEITLKVLGKNETATDKQLAVPKVVVNANYTFNNVWQEPIDEATPITSDRTHVAIFEDGKVKLTYEKGGTDVTGDVPEATKVKVGTKVRLANADGLTKENATFAGWKLDNDETIYQAGAEITLDKDKKATAQWKANTHKVEFDTNGGSKAPDTQLVEHGKTATKPATDPKKDNFVFTGWKETKNASETDPLFDFKNKSIIKDLVLFAQWTNAVQEINEDDLIDTEKFIRVTFLKGDHGTLKEGQTDGIEKVIYKVAKGLSLNQAKGLIVPEIVPAKYYKAKDANNGWDQALELGGNDITFTAQYEPKADVIPVDPSVTDETQIQNEKPDDMVLVTFKVDPNKAFMLGDTKFYVKKDEVVNIPTPLVRRLELGNGVKNDYVFRGWDLTELNNEWKFSDDTDIGDGAKVKPTITIILPSAGDPDVSVESMTEGAIGYLEVSRSNKTTTIKAIYDSDYKMYYFIIPDELGGKLKNRDRIKVYAELNGVRSDTREYRIK
ncbi:InlB B-repeat-containing protein [Fenollaria sporofastidiosus]|uniref:InlB B-repeat-containing protein n=1 Tax=Fenollaria sporofastidiosus TaxID=2811778 RepID=UPI001C001350|nr:InlB B-repeat-containing protein [Fenollaria sporofastidiosus]